MLPSYDEWCGGAGRPLSNRHFYLFAKIDNAVHLRKNIAHSRNDTTLWDAKMKPSVATKWNSQVRTVLCPAYLDDVRLDSNSDLGSRQAVSRHAEEVEEARRSRHQKPGTRTLQDTATEFLVANLSSLSTASLSTLPSHLVLRLWSAVVQRCVFHVAQKFNRFLMLTKRSSHI